MIAAKKLRLSFVVLKTITYAYQRHNSANAWLWLLLTDIFSLSSASLRNKLWIQLHLRGRGATKPR